MLQPFSCWAGTLSAQEHSLSSVTLLSLPGSQGWGGPRQEAEILS